MSKYILNPFSGILDAVGSSAGVPTDNETIVEATLYDPVDTSLPTGSTVVIDGVNGTNGMLVLFTNLSTGNNQIYLLGGVGTSITWTPQTYFNGSLTPSVGSIVNVLQGNSYANQIGQFNGTTFIFNNPARYFNSNGDYWEQSALFTTAISDNTTGTVFTVNASGSENMVIDYSILRNGNKETGTLLLTQNDTVVQLAYQSAVTTTTGVTFSAAISTGVLTLSYTSNSQGVGGTLKYSIKRWSDTAGGPGGPPSYSAGSGGNVTGSGTSGAVAIWSSGTNINYNSNLNYSSSDNALQLGSGSNIAEMTILQSVPIPSGSQTNSLLFTYPVTYTFAFVDYSAAIGTNYRTGTLLIAQDGSSVVDVTDTFTEIGSTGLTFASPTVTSTISGGNVQIRFNATGVGSGTYKYTMKRWY